MAEPIEILNAALRRANANLEQSLVADLQIRERADYVARNLKNRAGVRLLMACLLAKLHRPDVDVRKPYAEIGDTDAFSGITYDERYITLMNIICRAIAQLLFSHPRYGTEIRR